MLQDSKRVVAKSMPPQESSNVECSRCKADPWAVDPLATSCLTAAWTLDQLLSPVLRFLLVAPRQKILALLMEKLLSCMQRQDERSVMGIQD